MKRLLQSTIFAALFVACLALPATAQVSAAAQTAQAPVQCYAVVSADHAYPADGLNAYQDEGHFRQCFGPNPTAEQQQRIESVLKALQHRVGVVTPTAARTTPFDQRMFIVDRNKQGTRSLQTAGSTFFFFDSRADYESYFKAHEGTLGPTPTPTGACGATRLFPTTGLISAVFDNCKPAKPQNKTQANLTPNSPSQTAGTEERNPNPVETVSRELGVNFAIAKITTKSVAQKSKQ